MDVYSLTPAQIGAFQQYLQEERSPGTVGKYLRDVEAFFRWLDGRPVTREAAAAWKEHLLATGHAAVTVNSMLAALNGLFRFLGWDLQVRLLKIQRRIFREQSRELTREEYALLVRTAREHGRERLALLMETILSLIHI